MTSLMTTFFDWCREQVVLSGSKLGLAIAYSLKHERTFRTVLEDGHLVLSNNMAERAIKSLVMGRKNWLFSQSFEEAKATAIIMSLLETAKRHGLNSEKYMSYLLDHLPNEETLAKREVLEAYLPWAKEVQTNCQ
ncbi:UNVERIFIED_CONTAM: transposase [Streptococcus canis]